MVEKIHDETPTKRDSILTAARNLFAGNGYEETTIADIAKAAGIAVGTVYLYFHNKHDIYTAVALDIECSLARAFQDSALLALPIEQAIRAMIDAGFRVSREQRHLMSFLQVDMQSKEEIRQHKEIGDRITQSIDKILQNAVARGELAPFNTFMYAQILSLASGAVMHHCFAVEMGEREEQHRESLIEFVERLFFGPPLCKKE